MKKGIISWALRFLASTPSRRGHMENTTVAIVYTQKWNLPAQSRLSTWLPMGTWRASVCPRPLGFSAGLVVTEFLSHGFVLVKAKQHGIVILYHEARFSSDENKTFFFCVLLQLGQRDFSVGRALLLTQESSQL